MDRRIITILLLIVFSGGSTLYALFLILTFHHTVVHGANIASQVLEIAKGEPFFLIPVSAGILGWLITVYEVLTLRKKEITGSLRKRMSSEGFDRDLYRIFSGRGGIRRVAIMRALDTPKLRNEIANATNTDWKEVDRNVRILESVNLVRIQFSHGSLSVYYLTESGKELLDIILSHRDCKSSEAGTAHS